MNEETRFRGLHPWATVLRSFVVVWRKDDSGRAYGVPGARFTRWGAERKRRRCEVRQAYRDQARVGAGLPPLPGVRFEVVDLREHPGRRT